jgi:hypothetical protein
MRALSTTLALLGAVVLFAVGCGPDPNRPVSNADFLSCVRSNLRTSTFGNDIDQLAADQTCAAPLSDPAPFQAEMAACGAPTADSQLMDLRSDLSTFGQQWGELRTLVRGYCQSRDPNQGVAVNKQEDAMLATLNKMQAILDAHPENSSVP